MIKQLVMLLLLLGVVMPAQAEETKYDMVFTELNFNIDLADSSLLLADASGTTARSITPNIPDSAFEKPMFTDNDAHMYLGLASMAMGALAGMSVPEASDPDLLNTVHYKSAKLGWQLGAAAIGTGLWAHWDDFHLEDGLLDRDNLHVILGTLGVVGYYLAVKGAVDDYNNNNGTVTTDHASYGIFGGAAMLTAITITW